MEGHLNSMTVSRRGDTHTRGVLIQNTTEGNNKHRTRYGGLRFLRRDQIHTVVKLTLGLYHTNN